MHRQIGFISAVHAKHAKELRVFRRIGAKPHQRIGAGHASHAHEFAQQARCFRPGIDHAAAGIDNRAMRALQQPHRIADGLGIWFRARAIGTMALRGRFPIRRFVDEDILRQINHHRAGAAGFRDVKGFVHHTRQVFGFLDQIIMLGRGAGDAGGIGFLEGIIADQMRRHLAGQANYRH